MLCDIALVTCPLENTCPHSHSPSQTNEITTSPATPSRDPDFLRFCACALCAVRVRVASAPLPYPSTPTPSIGASLEALPPSLSLILLAFLRPSEPHGLRPSSAPLKLPRRPEWAQKSIWSGSGLAHCVACRTFQFRGAADFCRFPDRFKNSEFSTHFSKLVKYNNRYGTGARLLRRGSACAGGAARFSIQLFSVSSKLVTDAQLRQQRPKYAIHCQ